MVRHYLFKELADLDPYLNKHDEDVPEDTRDSKGFDLRNIRGRDEGPDKTLEPGPTEVPKTYYMLLHVEAKDTNVERAGRGVRQSQQYPFVIVSDAELLVQIGQEEQRLYDELQKTFDELQKARSQLASVRSDLPPEPGPRGVDFLSYSVRVEDVEKAVREGLRVTTKVHLDYDRILREMRTNRIQNKNRDLVAKVHNSIVTPLAKIRDADFGYAQAACGSLRRTLDNAALAEPAKLAKARAEAESASKELDALVSALNEVLLHMRGIVDINKLIAQLRELEQKEQQSVERLRAKKDQLEKEIFEGLGGPPMKP
jgi:hypothetical protein